MVVMRGGFPMLNPKARGAPGRCVVRDPNSGHQLL